MLDLVQTPDSINIKQQVNNIIDTNHLNRFISRKIEVSSKENQIVLHSSVEEFTRTEIDKITTNIQLQLNSMYLEHFSEQSFEHFLDQVVIISQQRLDFLVELLMLQQHIPENWPFILNIIQRLPSLDLPTTFSQIIDLANHHIRLEVILKYLESIEVTNKSFYNLYYLATHLEPTALKHISLDSHVFHLDFHKLSHFVKLLNKDPFFARDIILFTNKLSEDTQSIKSYVSLITSTQITQVSQIRFINTIYKNIEKPFTDRDLILNIIMQEDYISLNFYLSFFKRFNKTDLCTFIKKLKKMSVIEKIKLEIGLFTSKISSIKQITNG